MWTCRSTGTEGLYRQLSTLVKRGTISRGRMGATTTVNRSEVLDSLLPYGVLDS